MQRDIQHETMRVYKTIAELREETSEKIGAASSFSVAALDALKQERPRRSVSPGEQPSPSIPMQRR
jgi:hypothetical protein